MLIDGWHEISFSSAFKLASGLPVERSAARADGYPVFGGNGISGHSATPLIFNPTFVIGRVGEYCGSVHATEGASWVTDNALWAKHLSPGWDLKFVTYYLKWLNLGQYRSRTGQPLITQGNLGELRLIKPPLREQQGIAEVLDTLDNQIIHSKEEGEKINKLLIGLMDYFAAASSASDWKKIHLKDAGSWMSGGTPSTAESRFWDGDIPWISAASLKNFKISTSDRFITPAAVRSGSRLIPPGTVLFVVRGMSLKKELRVGVTQRDVAFGQDCKAILPRSDLIGDFLALSIRARSRETASMVDEAGHGTGRLPTDQISKLVIGIPPVSTQRRYVEGFETLDQRQSTLTSEIMKLEAIKQGLMEDLLTGRVRVSEAETVLENL